jgi:hypothetical protein
MKFTAAAIKNKSALEFKDFLVENTASYLRPFLQKEPMIVWRVCFAQ